MLKKYAPKYTVLKWYFNHSNIVIPHSASISLPFQLSNLLIFIILLIFYLFQDFQKAVNFCLSLARFIFVPGNLPLQLLYSVIHLWTGSGFQSCLMCLQRKVFKIFQLQVQWQWTNHVSKNNP